MTKLGMGNSRRANADLFEAVLCFKHPPETNFVNHKDDSNLSKMKMHAYTLRTRQSGARASAKHVASFCHHANSSKTPIFPPGGIISSICAFKREKERWTDGRTDGRTGGRTGGWKGASKDMTAAKRRRVTTAWKHNAIHNAHMLYIPPRLGPLLLSPLSAFLTCRGRCSLSPIISILGEWSGCHTGNGGKLNNS